MEKIIRNGMALVRKSTFDVVKVGDIVKDFRGDDHVIAGGEPPSRPRSTGRVHTDKGSYYPGVVDCEWIVCHVTPKPNDSCQHDWDRVEDPQQCIKCGISFARYVFTQCP